MDAVHGVHRDWAIAAIVVGSLLLVVVVVHVALRPPYYSLRDKVIVVTGGSSGIGKSIAATALRKGSHVAIMARTESLLQAARLELEGSRVSTSQRVTAHVLDVTDERAAQLVMGEAASVHGGTLHAVVCSAGTSNAKEFIHTTAQDFMQLLQLNIVGCRNAVHAALPHMRAPDGRVVLVSSQAGQVGLYGYTAYSSSKFGLAGFAQALSMELWPRRILVSLCFPPDTDTPLLAEENKTKPQITRMLSEASATVKPETVASDVIAGMERWTFQIATGFDGWMLATVTSGMSPAGSFVTGAVQVLTMSLWRLVGLLYVQYFYKVIEKQSKRSSSGSTLQSL